MLILPCGSDGYLAEQGTGLVSFNVTRNITIGLTKVHRQEVL